jgi:hypothetical protein
MSEDIRELLANIISMFEALLRDIDRTTELLSLDENCRADVDRLQRLRLLLESGAAIARGALDHRIQ